MNSILKLLLTNKWSTQFIWISVTLPFPTKQFVWLIQKLLRQLKNKKKLGTKVL